MSEPTGQRLTDEDIDVLMRAWRVGFTVKSDFARASAERVAKAALLGLITTVGADGEYGRQWNITAKGLRLIEDQLQTTDN